MVALPNLQELETPIRTIEEVNERIKRGDAVVLRADEFKELVKQRGVEAAAKEVDVVTTGTFGAMCSSGAVINLGHSDPPIKIDKAWINDVPVCHPGAAVDLYIGATQMSESKPFEYGGGHVIEDLICGKMVELRATAYGTDCYPRTKLETMITKYDLNQFYMLNFRNCYQKYVCATNGRDDVIYTYMGKLLPHYGNATFSGSGELNPLMNDPNYETIGIGTRIFLGGAKGYVIGEGTQHDPRNQMGTLMVKGNCMEMTTKFIRGASFTRYGTTIYIGLGIPIPILNMRVAEKAAITDEEIFVNVLDYGVPRRSRPILKKVSYAELKSGKIEIMNRTVKVSPLSSIKGAIEVAESLKKWIENGEFYLTKPVERLPVKATFKPMREVGKPTLVNEVVKKATICCEEETLKEAAGRMFREGTEYLIVLTSKGEIRGVLTHKDLLKAIVEGYSNLSKLKIPKSLTVDFNEPLDVVLRRMRALRMNFAIVVDEEGEIKGVFVRGEGYG